MTPGVLGTSLHGAQLPVRDDPAESRQRKRRPKRKAFLTAASALDGSQGTSVKQNKRQRALADPLERSSSTSGEREIVLREAVTLDFPNR